MRLCCSFALCNFFFCQHAFYYPGIIHRDNSKDDFPKSVNTVALWPFQTLLCLCEWFNVSTSGSSNGVILKMVAGLLFQFIFVMLTVPNYSFWIWVV